MAGTGVGKFSSTAGSNTDNLTVNFAENMAPSNVNNAARELMGHIRDMYEQLGDGYFEFGDGDKEYTIARVDADTLTIATAADLSTTYFAGRKIRVTDGGANVVEGTIASTSHGSSLQTVNLTGISLASGTPTKVEIGIDTAAFGGKLILDDDGDTFIEAPTDDTIDIHIAGAKDFVFTANTFTAESGSTIAAQALTATTVTASGEIDGGSLDISGDADIDGTTNLDVVDIDGAVDMASTLQVDGAITSSAGATITTADNLDTLSLVSTDADASAGPNLRLYRNNDSNADADVLGVIEFEGRNDNSQDVKYVQLTSQVNDITDGEEDGSLFINTMVAGANSNRINVVPTEVVFNEESKDLDFRVESNGNTHMLFVDGGNNRVGVGTAPDLGVGLHIRTADSSAGVNGSADNLVIEDSGDSGMSILAGTGNHSRISFGDSGDNDIGMITYDHGSNSMAIKSNATEALRMSTSQVLSTGAETGPDTTNGGLTIQTNAEDGDAFSLKNSDVAHGITSSAQADTYMKIRKLSASEGGAVIKGYCEGEQGIQIQGLADSANTTKSTSGEGIVAVTAYVKGGDGTQGVDPGSDANLFVVNQGGNAKFIVDTEGQLHSDGGAQSAYDTFEDAQLVRAFDLSHGNGVINSKFDKFISYNHEKLAEMKLVGREEDGTPNHFINVTGMQRLHNGAIWQQYEKTEKLANAMYELAKAAVGEEKANEILEQNEIKLLN